MRSYAVAASLLLLGVGAAGRAEEITVERFLLFRDGSVLRLPIVDETWTIQILRPEARIDQVPIRLSELQRLTFTAERTFEQKRVLLAAVAQLGSDDFMERERAQAQLLKQGLAIRDDLEAIQTLFTDAEIRARLRSLLGRWTDTDRGPGRALPFDVFQGRESSWGDAGEGSVAVRLDGQTRRLGRKDLLALTSEAPDVALLGAIGPGRGVRRLSDGDFPRGCLEEGFETTPDGRKLSVGENIERLFVDKGFLLSTSIKTSYVSVNEFVVQGKSKGHSAATHQPLYQGEISITFVKPGHADIPAGVTQFGCWLAWIEPNGTALHAYDLQGRELGHVATTKSGHEFLGMYSPVPVHKITVVPNLRIDPDYTLDDFIYSPPQTADRGHPEKYTAQFADGERVLCRDVLLTTKGVHMVGLPAGLPARTRPLAGLVRLLTPDDGKEKPTRPGVFVELGDGSVVFGVQPEEGDALRFAHGSGVLQQSEMVVALWGAAHPRASWLGKVPPTYPAMGQLDAAGKPSWGPVHAVKLGEAAAEWTDEAGRKVTRPYAELMPLLLRSATPVGMGSWHLRTRAGDDLVLSAAEPPNLAGSLARELTVMWQGKEIKLAAAEIASVYRVMKGP